MGWFKSLLKENSTDSYIPTRAISTGVFSPNGSGDYFKVFDMAGHEEYMPSHAFSLGHPHSAYVLLVSALDTNKLENARHWLCGISSCHNREQQQRPPLVMLISHGDIAPPGLSEEIYDLWRQLTSDEEFRDFFQFVGYPVVMDCRKLDSRQVHLVKKYLSQTLSNIVKVMCVKMRALWFNLSYNIFITYWFQSKT